MPKKKMKQSNGMQKVMTPEEQWEIVKRFDGEKNPFGGKTRKVLEADLREMSLDEMQKLATKLEVMPTNNVRLLKNKILKKFDTVTGGLNRSPIQVSSPLNVTTKPKLRKKLEDNLKNFSV